MRCSRQLEHFLIWGLQNGIHSTVWNDLLYIPIHSAQSFGQGHFLLLKYLHLEHPATSPMQTADYLIRCLLFCGKKIDHFNSYILRIMLFRSVYTRKTQWLMGNFVNFKVKIHCPVVPCIVGWPFALNVFAPDGLEFHLSWLNTFRSPLHREQLGDRNAALVCKHWTWHASCLLASLA